MVFVLILAIFGAVFMAFNNGANDVANAFASAVGSKALKLKHALVIAAVLNFFGAILLGGNVAGTLINEVIHIDTLNNISNYIIGMLSCLLASGAFVLLSTRTGLPVSSTHAIVGSMIGIALILGGKNSINWSYFEILTISWICSPFIAAICSLSMIKIIRLIIFRTGEHGIIQRTCRWIPLLGCITLSIIAYAVKNGTSLRNIKIPHMCLIFFVFILPLTYFVLHKIAKQIAKKSEETTYGAERIFRRFQAGTSCLVGFAIGSNDVANSITPVLAIYFVMQGHALPISFDQYSIPIWMLAISGLGMSAGVLVLGHKIISTLGHKITLLTNSRGFSVDFSTATTIILSSTLGIPVSSTHAATGAVIGVGLERGAKGLNLPLLTKIFLTWIITVPMAAVLTIIIFYLLRLTISLVM